MQVRAANYTGHIAQVSVYTHNTQPFYSFLDFVRDNPGEPVPEGTFRHLLGFLEQNEDNKAFVDLSNTVFQEN